MSSNIGWMAAFVGAVFHGSFTVPMKGKGANSVNIDPYVFQTFKSSMCFCTCWLVLFLVDLPKFTPLGIASAFFWVIGGTSGIFAVRNAGIAISVGIWSSVIVLVSYFWGIIIFDEKVKSKSTMFFSILILIIGLIGMSYSSSQIHNVSTQSNNIELIGTTNDDLLMESFLTDTLERRHHKHSTDSFDSTSATTAPKNNIPTINICGYTFSRRNIGIFAAIMNGVFSGTSFVPMQYLREEEKGLVFVINFAIGAAIVTSSFWCLRFLLLSYQNKSFSLGYKTLPSFHLDVMLVPGCLSGLLWSVGNMGNIMAVTYLGQAIGISLGQTAMIVSGLWGIFWYKEIVHTKMILLWFTSAFITFLAIFGLCHEHQT